MQDLNKQHNTFSNNFYAELSRNSDSATVTKLKEYSYNIQKIAISYSRRKFLLRCRYHDYLPKHIENIKCRFDDFTFYNKASIDIFNDIIQKTCSKILNLQIKDINKYIFELEKNQNNNKKYIHRIHKTTEINAFFDSQETKKNNLYFKNNHRLNNKFIILKKNNSNPPDINASKEMEGNLYTNKWFVNLSDTEIPQDVMDIARLGPKFCSPNSINKKDVLDCIKTSKVHST